MILLPNGHNVLMSARSAAQEASPAVTVVPTTTLQAGLAAAVAFDPAASAHDNLEAMLRVAEAVATGAVTIASREVRGDGLAIPKGAWLGLAEGSPVAGGSRRSRRSRARSPTDSWRASREILTLLTGEEPQPLDALVAELRSLHPDVELEVHEGGQPNYPLLLSAE